MTDRPPEPCRYCDLGARGTHRQVEPSSPLATAINNLRRACGLVERP